MYLFFKRRLIYMYNVVKRWKRSSSHRQFYLKKCLGTRGLGFQFNRQYWKQENIENDS